MTCPKYANLSFVAIASRGNGLAARSRTRKLGTFSVQDIRKTRLQHQSSKASILRLSAFVVVQLSLPYSTTGKTSTLTRRILREAGMPLLAATGSKRRIALRPSVNLYLTSLAQFPSSVTSDPKKTTFLTTSTCPLSSVNVELKTMTTACSFHSHYKILQVFLGLGQH